MYSGGGLRRLFEPVEARLPGFSAANLLVSSNKQQTNWRQLSRVRWVGGQIIQQPQKNTMVISIDGACRANGDHAIARASCGVYFDANSPFNSQACLQDTSRQTNQLAEIIAATRALNRVENILTSKSSINHVILVTDSAYLANSISQHVYAWEMKSWKSTTGGEIVNRRPFQVLHGIIKKMEADGFLVQFWLVPRQANREADRLANIALDRLESKKTTDRTSNPIPSVNSTPGGPEHRVLGTESSEALRRSWPRELYAVSAWR